MASNSSDLSGFVYIPEPELTDDLVLDIRARPDPGWSEFTTLGDIGDFFFATAGGPFAPGFNVQQFGATGNGTTDDTKAINGVISSAAGRGPVIFPGVQGATTTPAVYLIGAPGISVPSNSWLIIEAGATLRLANAANSGMLTITDDPIGHTLGANNVYIEMRGTLDGNAFNQTGGVSGGISSVGVSTNVYIDGFHQGLVTDFVLWPLNLGRMTNSEVRNLAMTNSGNSVGYAGIATFHAIVGGTLVYNNSTGATTLTTSTAHGLNPGDLFTVSRVVGTGNVTLFQGEWTALAGTSGVTVNYNPGAGIGPSPTITSGNVSTTIKCYNVGFNNCYISDIRDIGIVLYGGCVNSYIRNCNLANGASALIFLDNGQPGMNVDCEISGCYQYGGEGGIGTASNTLNLNNSNCRIFNNTIENVHGAGLSISACDYCEVYDNVVHDSGVTFATAVGVNAQAFITGSSHVNFHDNSIRNTTSPGYYSRHTTNAIASSPAPTYDPSTGAVSLTTVGAHTINVGDQFLVNQCFGSGAYLSLNGFWIATAGTTGSILNFTGPTGLTLTLKSGSILKYTNAVAVTIASGTYDTATGNVVLTTSAPHGIVLGPTPQPFVVSGVTGTGPVANLNGYQTATAGTTGTTLNFTTTSGLAAITVTGGTIQPPTFGVATSQTDYCRIVNNFIGDWQAAPNMVACIGGVWGNNGFSEGNRYGPRLATGPLYGYPADAMAFQAGAMGLSYDTVTDIYYGRTTGRNVSGEAFFPNKGLTTGWNLASGAGEVDFFCGQDSGTRGGFNFLQVTNDGTINASTGVGGSLLSNDGLGNTRLGGALVHGAPQTASLANGGTVTVNQDTSFVFIQNSASIATAVIAMPVLSALGYNTGTELELNFQNPVGSLSWSGASVTNPPTAVSVAGASFNFINTGGGTVWTRRIAM